MNYRDWQELIFKYTGRIIGVLVAILLYVSIFWIGFIKFFILSLLIWLGYMVGKSADRRGNFKYTMGNLFDRWLRR